MKKTIATTLLLLSTHAYAGGSETNPFLEMIEFQDPFNEFTTGALIDTKPDMTENLTNLVINGKNLSITSPIIIIDTESEIYDGGVETKPKPKLPTPTPIQLFLPPQIAPTVSIDHLVEGGSETIFSTINGASGFETKVDSLRYLSETPTSVYLQINQTNQFIKLSDAEVSKVAGLRNLIGESVSKNSAWIKTN